MGETSLKVTGRDTTLLLGLVPVHSKKVAILVYEHAGVGWGRDRHVRVRVHALARVYVRAYECVGNCVLARVWTCVFCLLCIR